MLLGRRDMDDGVGVAGLLGGRELDSYMGEGWSTGQERPGRRRLCCWVGGGRTARRERVGLLGVKGLVYWAGETWKTVALLGGRGQD